MELTGHEHQQRWYRDHIRPLYSEWNTKGIFYDNRMYAEYVILLFDSQKIASCESKPPIYQN